MPVIARAVLERLASGPPASAALHVGPGGDGGSLRFEQRDAA